MSETQPSDTTDQAHFTTPPNQGQPYHPDVSEARKAADAKAAQERAQDLARLSELQKEYLDLRDRVEKGTAAKAAAVDPVAADHARKGDVVREMDVIKRKYNLA
jgi:hypothetical protein